MFLHPENIRDMIKETFSEEDFISARQFIFQLSGQAYDYLDREVRIQDFPPKAFAMVVANSLQLVALCVADAILRAVDQPIGVVAGLDNDLYFKPHDLADILFTTLKRQPESYSRWPVKIFNQTLPEAMKDIETYSYADLEDLKAIRLCTEMDTQFRKTILFELNARWIQHDEAAGGRLPFVPKIDL